MTPENEALKKEIKDYIRTEIEHVNEGVGSKFESVSSLALNFDTLKNNIYDKIDNNFNKLDDRIVTEAKIEKISGAAVKEGFKDFWETFRWFVGVVAVILTIVVGTAIIMWADVRDYPKYKEKAEILMKKNETDVTALTKTQLNSTIQEDLKKILEKFENYNVIHKENYKN